MGVINEASATTRYYTETAAPGTPASGKAVTYVKTDGKLYLKDDAGLETDLTAAGGGGDVATDAIWDAAGDLVQGTGANTAARVALGGLGSRLKAGSSTVAWLKDNLAGTAAPTANEDSGDGYEAGSLWVDTTNDKAYICLDPTLTAAVWTEITAGGGGITRGTTFPGSPSTGDLYQRSDIDELIFVYDGTRWMTQQMFTVGGYSGALTADNSTYLAVSTNYPIYLEHWEVVVYVGGAATWVATLNEVRWDGTTNTLDTQSTAGNSAVSWYAYKKDLNVVLDTDNGNTGANARAMQVLWDEQTGAVTFLGMATVFYRMIAT